MKHFLLGLAACSLTLSTFAQEPFQCGNAELRQRLIETDPTFLQREAEYEAEIQELIRNNAEFRDEHVLVTIPVVFHILHLGGRENISDEQIYSELEILNRTFRKMNVNEAITDVDLNTALPHFQEIAADMRMQFALPTLDPLGNCTNGIDRIYTTETLRGKDESKLRPWPRGRYLNVWVTNTIESGAAGYAYKPGSVEGFGQIRDGIMIKHDYVGEIGTSGTFTSRALTHEIGHYFNLDHLWGATNEPEVECGDDGVEDTPMTKGHSDCDPRIDITCSQTAINGIMDFADVTTTSGTADPTPVPEPIAAYFAGTPSADTIGVAIDVSPFTASGVSANPVVAGEFAFSGWDFDPANDGIMDYASLTGGVTPNGGKYYDFYFVPNTAYAMHAQQISFTVRRSADGPRTFVIRKDPFTSNLPFSAGPNSPVSLQANNVAFFTGDSAGQATITTNLSGSSLGQAGFGVRIFAWNAESAEGYFSIDNVQIVGNTGVIENVENFMEYAYCQKLFTEGQSERVRAALNSPVGQRSQLWQETTLQQVGIAEGFQAVCAPVADFYAVPGTDNGFNSPAIPYPPISCAGMDVMFKDNSSAGVVTSWSWTFQDGDPATSTEQNPVVTFNSSGWKEVTLTVSNDQGSDTKTSPFEVYIGSPEEAMTGLSSYDFEPNVGTWPFIHENYEGNITQWSRFVGAGHSGNACIRLNSGERDQMNFIDVENGGDYDDLISPLMDLTGVQGATLSFWYSYSTQTTDLEEATEKLQIQKSDDCGRTWDFLTTQTGSTLSANPSQGAELITNGNSTTPGAWYYKEYNIPNTALTDNVRFRWRFISSPFSNNLYIDDINIGGAVGMNDASANGMMNIFPNPTNDHFFVHMVGMDVQPTEIILMDSRGAIVMRKVYTPQGGNGIKISSQELGIADGLYVIRASNDMGTSTQKLTVGR